MSQVTNMQEAEIQKLKLENDGLRAELDRMEKEFVTIPKLRKESRVPGWIWNALKLSNKLMGCKDEKAMMLYIKDAEQVADGELGRGEIVGMGAESDLIEDEQEISEKQKSKIRQAFKIIEGGKKDG